MNPASETYAPISEVWNQVVDLPLIRERSEADRQDRWDITALVVIVSTCDCSLFYSVSVAVIEKLVGTKRALFSAERSKA